MFIAETEVDRDCWVIAFNKQQEEKVVPAIRLEALRRFSLTTSNPLPISVKFGTISKINPDIYEEGVPRETVVRLPCVSIGQ